MKHSGVIDREVNWSDEIGRRTEGKQHPLRENRYLLPHLEGAQK